MTSGSFWVEKTSMFGWLEWRATFQDFEQTPPMQKERTTIGLLSIAQWLVPTLIRKELQRLQHCKISTRLEVC